MIRRTSADSHIRVADATPEANPEANREVEPTSLSRRCSSASSPPRQALTQGDKSLASYLVARHVDKRPVSEPLLNMLKRGNDAVEETREVMRLGRANVKADLLATGHLAYHAKLALRDVLMEARVSDHATQAVLASSAGAGYCTEFAAVCHYTQLPTLQPGESVVHLESHDQNHSWDTLSHDQTGLTVVLDAWGDGPAVEASDATSMKAPLRHSVVKRTTHEGMPCSYEDAQRAQVMVDLKLNRMLDARMEQRKAEGHKLHPRASWDPEPIVRKSFSKRVKRVLDQVTLPDGRTASPTEVKLRRNLLKVASKFSSLAACNLEALRQAEQQSRRTREGIAIRVVRSLGADEAEAKRAAPEILEAARHLRRLDAKRVTAAAMAAAHERQRGDPAND